MTIDVMKVCGEDIISRDAGRKVRELILQNWSEPSIEITFGGRRVGSVSFFDEAFGLLMKRGQKGVDEIRIKLKFPDLRPEDRTLLNHVFSTRVQEAQTS
ncbi:MAG TPA: DUF4325 domain-containing protein [bacterium]|nr:DUF4325 domain-containing protein [bacterium]